MTDTAIDVARDIWAVFVDRAKDKNDTKRLDVLLCVKAVVEVAAALLVDPTARNTRARRTL